MGELGDLLHAHARVCPERGGVVPPDEQDALAAWKLRPQRREHRARQPAPALRLLDTDRTIDVGVARPTTGREHRLDDGHVRVRGQRRGDEIIHDPPLIPGHNDRHGGDGRLEPLAGEPSRQGAAPVRLVAVLKGEDALKIVLGRKADFIGGGHVPLPSAVWCRFGAFPRG